MKLQESWNASVGENTWRRSRRRGGEGSSSVAFQQVPSGILLTGSSLRGGRVSSVTTFSVHRCVIRSIWYSRRTQPGELTLSCRRAIRTNCIHSHSLFSLIYVAHSPSLCTIQNELYRRSTVNSPDHVKRSYKTYWNVFIVEAEWIHYILFPIGELSNYTVINPSRVI